MRPLVAAAACAAACGSALDDHCDEFVVWYCNRWFECVPPDARDAAFLEKFGATPADCVPRQQPVLPQCRCEGGRTFHPEAAARCREGYRALSCADFTAGVEPAACAESCT